MSRGKTMVEYCTVSNDWLTELIMPFDVVNRLEAADERTLIISVITSNARSFILVSCLSLGDEHMLKIFRNGLWDADNNTYYLGRAKIILPPDKPFPKILPRIVDDAIREKTHYNVLVNVHEDDRMTIKYIPGNKRLRTIIDYHRIGDKYVPIVTVPAFSFDSDKRGEFYCDTAKWAERNYYFGYYKGYVIKKFIQVWPQYHVKWIMINEKNGARIAGGSKYDPYKLEKMIEKNESGYLSHNDNFEMDPMFDDNPNKIIIEPNNPPWYRVYPRVQDTRVVPVGTDDNVITNGKIAVYDSYQGFEEAANFVGDVEAVIDTKNGTIEIGTNSVVRTESYVAVKEKNMIKFGYLDGRIRGIVNDSIDPKVFVEILGNAYNNVVQATVKWDLMYITYESETKRFTTRLKVDYETKTISGPIPDFTGWRYVKNQRFDNVVDKILLKGWRKKFPIGPISPNIIREIIAHNTSEIELHTKNNFIIRVYNTRDFVIERQKDNERIKLLSGKITDDDYYAALVSIKEHNGIVFYL